MMNNKKTALVTGGAKGIGSAICRALAKDGFKIAVNYNNSEKDALKLKQDLDEKGIKSGKEKIHKFVSDLNKEYFMLLCADLVYYTMFIMDSFSVENTADVVIECLENLGKIKSIDFTEGKQAIEIWIQKDEEVVVAYFFNYDQGVIKCKR